MNQFQELKLEPVPRMKLEPVPRMKLEPGVLRMKLEPVPRMKLEPVPRMKHFNIQGIYFINQFVKSVPKINIIIFQN